MTVADLMKMLAVMPQDYKVFTSSYDRDGGPNDTTVLPLNSLEFNVHMQSVILG